jgi:Rrf2 family protein
LRRALALLQRQGLLLAHAGQHGGYTLARPARDISLLEVVEAVEGPLMSRECVLRDLPCGADGDCVLHEAWNSAREALRTVLAQTPLASVTAGSVPASDGSVVPLPLRGRPPAEAAPRGVASGIAP